jgi:uncharacterized damage-inducible protein DinB
MEISIFILPKNTEMTASRLLVLNFEEIRRRSIKLWSGIPADAYHWRPDAQAMSVIEMIRHVLEGEHWFHRIIEAGKSVVFESPWKDRPYTTVADELAFAQPFRDDFLKMAASLTAEELEQKEIVREELGQRRKLGDYLLRTAYHESVHTGQLLDYLRTAKVERIKVWD